MARHPAVKFGISQIEVNPATAYAQRSAMMQFAQSLEESIQAAIDAGFDLAVSSPYPDGDYLTWLTRFVRPGEGAPDDGPVGLSWIVYHCAPAHVEGAN